MSVKLTGYVWDGCAHAGLKLTKVTIMARLADFSNDEGISWPSIETIARQLGAGISTIRTLIGELERDGWLQKETRRKGNRNASNIYKLNISRLKASAESAERKKSSYDMPNSDRSESDASKFDRSESSKKGSFDPPESGGDPLDLLKHDPSLKDLNCQVGNNSSEVSNEKPETKKTTDPEIEITEQAIEVLAHLNLTTGSKYQKSKSSLENIRARLKEHYSIEDLKLVIDYKFADWGSQLNMSEYLRPCTLFLPSKFPGYLSSAGRWHDANRPQKLNGKWIKPNRITPATNETPPGFMSPEEYLSRSKTHTEGVDDELPN